MSEVIVCYAERHLRDDYERLGWKLRGLDSHHSTHSILAEWKGDGEPVYPPGSRYLRKRENAALLPGAGE